ncbi:MAG: hypothetical protein GX575_11685 [Candidatus Anammoximicrobium sp.]|nr:hypothetical protein [Candidatus Anammoximicrobium sp.]
MLQRIFLVGLLAALSFVFSVTPARAAKPWELLIPFKRVEASADKIYRLTDDHGPWMILATSFAGPGAEKQAQTLVLELRKKYNLEAYLHRQTYDFTEPVVGLGLTPLGGPKIMKYANAAKFDEIAVLVGNFETVNDPKVEKLLEQLKYARPECLDVSKNKGTTQRFVGLREIQRRLTPDLDKKQRGPMGNAFVTRNPLLPQEYFVPKGLDPLVEQMNRDVEYSLLKNRGQYSVRVATFRGSSTMKINEAKKLPSKLEEAAVKAHELTLALRKKGIEAYEFHDRYESIVTIGSFDSVGAEQPGGTMELNPAVHQIMQEYGPKRQPLPGQEAIGLMPRALNGISFDVQPVPVQVPRTTIAASFTSSHRALR